MSHTNLESRMSGILAYGAYIPYHRLQRSAIGGALGSGGGKGSRAVAAHDEDTTSMAVEAARVALRSGIAPQQVFFSTTAPAYLDKTNATAIHAALALDDSALAVDMGGAVRSGIGALLAAASAAGPTLVTLSDIRTGLPGSVDERDGGDGAAAFIVGEGEAIAEVVAHASATAEFLDRWRVPQERSSRIWEERFGEAAYGPLADAAFAAALKQAGLTPEQLDHLIVAGVHPRAARAFASSAGARKEALAPDLSGSIGNAGTAQPGILLADVLDRASAGQTIALVVLSDGATAIVLRTTAALESGRANPTVAEQVAAGNDALPYANFLTWRGFLDREPPRRPETDPPASPPSYRREEWKFAFTGSRCDECGMRHLPPARVCIRCHAVDRMTPERLADVPATVATYSVDRLAFSLSPPVSVAVLDFEGGGRYRTQLTDVNPKEIEIGMPVEMTFRRFATSRGVHNYFWKARPVRRAKA